MKKLMILVLFLLMGCQSKEELKVGDCFVTQDRFGLSEMYKVKQVGFRSLKTIDRAGYPFYFYTGVVLEFKKLDCLDAFDNVEFKNQCIYKKK